MKPSDWNNVQIFKILPLVNAYLLGSLPSGEWVTRFLTGKDIRHYGDGKESILEATRQLLALMVRANRIEPEDVASAVFTTTMDLNAEFPALAARQLGWVDVALMCYHELDVPGALRRCIRILLHWNTVKPATEVVHVYIKQAADLRPDLEQLPPVDWDDLEKWITQHLDHTGRTRTVRGRA